MRYSKDLSLVRKKILNSIQNTDSGHLGPSFSCTEILFVILKKYINFKNNNRNKIILSKGHAAPAIYAIFDYLKLLKKNELNTLRKFSSRLQGHPDKKKLKLLDFGTGALGQGLSVSIGYAHSSKLLNKKNFIFCVLGDGELQEGQVWESAMYIGSNNMKNIITFIDGNKFQNEFSIKETLKEVNLRGKWESFGFKYIETDGHSTEKLEKIIKNIMSYKYKKPVVVYCNTIKGKVVSFMEGNNKYHSVKKLPLEQYNKALKELDDQK
jgi:transketolase